MREKEEPSAIWREEKEPVRPNTYLQKTKKILQKPAEMEQQLKQQLMQKKNFMQISRKKKRKYSFFHLTIRKK